MDLLKAIDRVAEILNTSDIKEIKVKDVKDEIKVEAEDVFEI